LLVAYKGLRIALAMCRELTLGSKGSCLRICRVSLKKEFLHGRKHPIGNLTANVIFFRPHIEGNLTEPILERKVSGGTTALLAT
jgi:hypothetical protein